MARRENTFWNRNKFKLNGLLLILPFYFLYQALQPSPSPDVWDDRQVGPFKVALQPLNHDVPYSHHDDWVKDFSVHLREGEVADIRQGYVNIGETAMPLHELEQDDEGILHGTDVLQHVHAIAPQFFEVQHQVWLTIQTWDGDIHQAYWSLPDEWLE
ncbi:hypothetical protein CWE09_07395 [Aliidiomarina minuta]|uniref:Uncharacterized protein n=1 Tax=Aliidiomarina minuta TaxID=880057 RepID=A0A432W8P8_9GAMM|nr:hypothetical protein [Aliidiomarina minuta]RUO26523.1 hypothetical protein CWE09_07395 [Aliidiomarina minuta]